MKLLMQGLTPAEQVEMAQALEYIDERIDGGGQMPEGGIGQLLNGLSPNVRRQFQMLSQFIEQPRHQPFQPKWSEGENLEMLGLDAERGGLVKGALDAQEVAGKLQQRMGTDATKRSASPTVPPTLREQVEAALNASMEGAR